MRLLSLMLALALVLAGCQAPPSEQPPVTLASLTLGMTDDVNAFQPFAEGQEVTLVQGAQGGFHVWVRYRYDGELGEAQLERGAHRAGDGKVVLRSSSHTGMVAESVPLPMFMCPSPIGLSVIDQPIVFELRFTTEDGTPIAAGSTTLVPRCPETGRDFCLRICTG